MIVSPPRVDLLVDHVRSHGAYAVLDLRLPCGLDVPPHVHEGHSAVAHVLGGVIELREDGVAPRIVRGGPIVLREGRTLSLRVLETAHLVAVVTPAGVAPLLAASAEPGLAAQERAALLAAAGITLPRGNGGPTLDGR